MIDPLLQTFPLWLIGVLLIAACIAASEVGLLIRRRVARGRSDPTAGKSDAEVYIIGAIFGLLAFIIGLTFSIAIDRFDNRRGCRPGSDLDQHGPPPGGPV